MTFDGLCPHRSDRPLSLSRPRCSALAQHLPRRSRHSLRHLSMSYQPQQTYVQSTYPYQQTYEPQYEPAYASTRASRFRGSGHLVFAAFLALGATVLLYVRGCLLTINNVAGADLSVLIGLPGHPDYPPSVVTARSRPSPRPSCVRSTFSTRREESMGRSGTVRRGI
jgi:hypothetical protein